MSISSDNGTRPPAYLDARDLAAGYGGDPIVSGISLQVARGEIAAVVGPNGSGKSTMLKALVGILPLMSGRISLGEATVTEMRVEDRARLGLGYVPQIRHVFGGLTVAENLRLGGYRLSKREVKTRTEEILVQYPTLVPLIHRPTQKLSGGEQKLVAIASVMMTRPQMYVLDEPASNLSAGVAERLFRDHISQLASSGAAVLLVEQKAKLALEISDWSYLLVNGRVRMSSPAATMLEDTAVAEMFLGQLAG